MSANAAIPRKQTCSEALQRRSIAVESIIQQHYTDGVPEEDINDLLNTKHNFPSSIADVKKLISEFCVRNRYRFRNPLRDTRLIRPQTYTGNATSKAQKSYKRPVNVNPRISKSRRSENGFSSVKLERSSEQQRPNPGYEGPVSWNATDLSDTANADHDNQNVVGAGLSLLFNDETRDLLEHDDHGADNTCSVVYAFDPSWSELKQISACVMLSNALKQTTLLEDDILTMEVPLLYWQQYSAFFDGSLTKKYCGYQKGNQRLAKATLYLQHCLPEKSVRLMTTILRIALLQCEDSLQPV